MAKVSGKDVAEAILKKLEKDIQGKNIHPALAIILAGNDPSSRIYVQNKIKTAKRIGINARLFEFSKNQFNEVLKILERLNKDKKVHGVIIQYPVYEGWNFDELVTKVDPQKDVDGFLPGSPFSGATALGVWEMLTAFSLLEGFKKTAAFLKNKKIVLIGKGKAAGGPTLKLLVKKGFKVAVVVKDTKNPNSIIKKGDVVISATGVKNIVNKSNLKKGAYVVGVGVGKEIINGKMQIYGDIKEEEVSKIAKLYCPTVGGIGPLTIVSLLKNVVESAKKAGK
ncbi:bifunctional 5,10-methylenetetrahydrofolate dehydrogenase/5,10-methenyltetrahydrofolate cyclohydrolase [Candidatus Daviesbacteria bacterium]|nr:bifunctional 5,10-methylenetetrahydrofolate dehydrogenase/5,10-methenyltetrahydrofolate cyclohydrolase [Candidatus Daviesbacteria bacterium]